MLQQDLAQSINEQVKLAVAEKRPVNIVGGNSKVFYGQQIEGEKLSLDGHSGIVEYEPSELVITVRCGTLLSEVQNVLKQNGQMLPFDPPHFAASATIGGMVATGLSGPSRPFVGSVRDHILGCRIINGKGELLNFGGRVMKNVAGYDASRLMVGAMGTLGVLLEVSIKVLPLAEYTKTLAMGSGILEAIDIMNVRASQALPLSAVSYDGDSVLFRLSGTETAVQSAQKKMAGDELKSGEDLWLQLREQTHFFFDNDAPLWRVSLAPATLPLGLSGQWLFDWCGGLRWLKSYEPAKNIRDAVQGEGGHATLFRAGADDSEIPVFHPQSTVLAKYQQRIKHAFDPYRILNRNRMYPDEINL